MRLHEIVVREEQVADQLQKALRTAAETYRAIYPGRPSLELAELLAAGVAQPNYRLRAAVRDAFMPTAVSGSAIATIATMLGATPRGRAGARVTVELHPRGPMTRAFAMPVGTRFTGLGLEWHLREEALFTVGTAAKRVELFQGTPVVETRLGTGRTWQRITVGRDFALDAATLRVRVGRRLWREATGSLVDAENDDDPVLYARHAVPDGRTAILFGERIVPSAGEEIVVSYAETLGRRANGDAVGERFGLLSSLNFETGRPFTLDGMAVSDAVGGDDPESASLIRFTAPRIFAANGLAVRRQDYEGLIIRRGGLASVSVWAEHEEELRRGRLDIDLMNRVWFSALRKDVYERRAEIGTLSTAAATFELTLPDPAAVRGSVRVEAGDHLFTDVGGDGALTAPTVTRNCATGGVASTNSVLADGAAAHAFDRGSNIYQSNHLPTPDAPVRLAYDLGANPRHVRSFRLQSSVQNAELERMFPRTVALFGSNLTTPSLLTDDDWTNLTANIELEDPGPEAWSAWVTAAANRRYRHLMIRVADAHPGSTRVKVKEVEMQAQEDASTVSYDDGRVRLALGANPAAAAPVLARYLVPDAGPAERDDLVADVRGRNHFSTLVTYEPPICRTLVIEAEVGVIPTFPADEVRADVEAAIRELFAFDVYSLGRIFYLSDLYERANNVPGVDYVRLLSPKKDIILDHNEFAFVVDVLNTYPASTRTYGSLR